MATLSEQIRQFVRDSGASLYALAKAAKVAPSVMTRFMSGDAGLTLKSLDRLAEVLGLQVVAMVQQVPRPRNRGRQQKEKGMKSTTLVKKVDWSFFAKKLAAEAHNSHFSSRRGVWFLEDLGVLCVYNNNPWGDGSRDLETKQFRDELRKEGIRELAYETFGDEQIPDYTYAMIIEAGEDRMSWVANTMAEIVVRVRGQYEARRR